MDTPLCVISICNGIAIPVLALQHAIIDVTNSFPEYSYRITHTVIIEIDEQANNIAEEIMKAHNYPGQIFLVKDAADLEKWCMDNIFSNRLINVADYTVVILSGTPCKSISYGCKHLSLIHI